MKQTCAGLLRQRYWPWELSRKLKHSILEMIIQRREDWLAVFPGFSSKTSSLTSPAAAECLHDWITEQMGEREGERGGWILFAWRKTGGDREKERERWKRRERCFLMCEWDRWRRSDESEEKEKKGWRWWNRGGWMLSFFTSRLFWLQTARHTHQVPLPRSPS